jgi:phage gpG-like protein
MAQRANITSVEAIQEFRANLVIYLNKARPVLDEAASEVSRVRIWLETERRPYWVKQYLQRIQRLEEAEASLFSAKLSRFAQVSAAQQSAVQKARLAVGKAEEKIRSIKRWLRDYETRTSVLLKQLEKLDNVFSLDLTNAVAYLNELIDTLQKYAAMHAPAGETAPAPAVESETSPETGKKKS